MSKNLLAKFICEVLAEMDRPARVPQQLISPDDVEDGNKDEGNETEAVDEFSSCASVAGYSAPLGMSPDALGRKKNRSAKK